MVWRGMVAVQSTMDRTNEERSRALRAIPSLDALLRRVEGSTLPRALVVREARAFLDEVREDVLHGRLAVGDVEHRCSTPAVEEIVSERCRRAQTARHRRVVNATGVVLHTGIGRAPLAASAILALQDAAGYAIVEIDAETGKRNQREETVAGLLCELLGVGGALVVNNNAAMTALVLGALAPGREVVVSRGELVEIGGGFRMPDVMAATGCKLVEVGTTNRTRAQDYEKRIGSTTAMLLKVHPSNFRMEGFTAAATLQEIATLARRSGILACEDLGSGLLVDQAIQGLEDEPRVRASVSSGVHLVWFSGDKLLGGPQCGILVGEQDLVAQVRAHPLYRAFRCDKLKLAALEATLRIYRDGDPVMEIPTLRLLAEPVQRLEARAMEFRQRLGTGRVVASESFAGSGANPARPLPSFALALPGGGSLVEALRTVPRIPVFARVVADEALLDLRTLVLEDLDEIVALVRSVTQKPT